MSGREMAGSKAGREHILASLETVGLQVPTARLPHQINGLLSIDHIAVRRTWSVAGAVRHRAFAAEARLSDHDAYVVDVVANS